MVIKVDDPNPYAFYAAIGFCSSYNHHFVPEFRGGKHGAWIEEGGS